MSSQELPELVSARRPKTMDIEVFRRVIPSATLLFQVSSSYLQECCFEYAQHHLRIELKSALWKMQIIGRLLQDKNMP